MWQSWLLEGRITNLPAVAAVLQGMAKLYNRTAVLGVVAPTMPQESLMQVLLVASSVGPVLRVVALNGLLEDIPDITMLMAQPDLLRARVPIPWWYGWHLWAGVWLCLVVFGLLGMAGLRQVMPVIPDVQDQCLLAERCNTINRLARQAAMVQSAAKTLQIPCQVHSKTWHFLIQLGSLVPYSVCLTQLSWHNTGGFNAPLIASKRLSIAGNATDLEDIAAMIQAVQKNELVRFIQLEKLVAQGAAAQHYNFLVKIALT